MPINQGLIPSHTVIKMLPKILRLSLCTQNIFPSKAHQPIRFQEKSRKWESLLVVGEVDNLGRIPERKL